MGKLAIYGGKPVRSDTIYYGRQWINEDDIAAVSQVLRDDFITCGASGENGTRISRLRLANIPDMIPMLPERYKMTNIHKAARLEKLVIVGCTAVILPGVTIGEGCSVGAMSLVTKPLEARGMHAESRRGA